MVAGHDECCSVEQLETLDRLYDPSDRAIGCGDCSSRSRVVPAETVAHMIETDDVHKREHRPMPLEQIGGHCPDGVLTAE